MPWGFQEYEDPKFQDNQHIKSVSLSALCTGAAEYTTVKMTQMKSNLLYKKLDNIL